MVMNGRFNFKRLIKACLRPVWRVLQLPMRPLVRRLSYHMASDIVPLADLARELQELRHRVDAIDGFHWNQAAVAKRLAAIEDQVERLLQRESVLCGPEEAAPFGPAKVFLPASAPRESNARLKHTG